MRLDKFLKVSRLVKRRTVANTLCDAEKVLINNKPAKASASVKVGDELSIIWGEKTTTVKVLEVPEKALPSNADPSLLFTPIQ